ncbi:MAG: patatin-like phospholipase family protein [bacterium]|nr:patatin-like phospholipase family protein [bacterium]
MSDTHARGKTAIVLIGGGMRSAYSAGFLYALATKLGIQHPDIMIAASGSAGSAFYFAAGQYESGKHIWTELLSTPLFLSHPRVWRVMQIDYLIDTVFKKQDPLDFSAFRRSQTEMIVAVTNTKTGNAEFLDARKSSQPLELLRATKAHPVLYRKTVEIDGERYIDGAMGMTPQIITDEAVRRGARGILCINEMTSRRTLVAHTLRVGRYVAPSHLRTVLKQYPLATPVPMVPRDVKLLYIFPGKLPVSRLSRNKKALFDTFERGAADALAREKELRSLFNV